MQRSQTDFVYQLFDVCCVKEPGSIPLTFRFNDSIELRLRAGPGFFGSFYLSFLNIDIRINCKIIDRDSLFDFLPFRSWTYPDLYEFLNSHFQRHVETLYNVCVPVAKSSAIDAVL